MTNEPTNVVISINTRDDFVRYLAFIHADEIAERGENTLPIDAEWVAAAMAGDPRTFAGCEKFAVDAALIQEVEWASARYVPAARDWLARGGI